MTGEQKCSMSMSCALTLLVLDEGQEVIKFAGIQVVGSSAYDLAVRRFTASCEMMCEYAMDTRKLFTVAEDSVSSTIGTLFQFGWMDLMRIGVSANSGFRRLDLLLAGWSSCTIVGVAIGVFACVSRM